MARTSTHPAKSSRRHMSIYGTVVGVPVRKENGWCVVDIRRKNGAVVRAQGTLWGVKEGDTITMKGMYGDVGRNYGEQLVIEDWNLVNDDYLKGIEQCLSSGIYYGIGPVRAHEMVRRFGANVISVIDKEPEKLLSIPGINEKVVDSIRHRNENESVKHLRRALITLMQYDITPEEETEKTRRLFTRQFVERLIEEKGVEFVQTVRANPYCLCELVDGVGFISADRIAKNMGIDRRHPFRIAAGIEYTLLQAADSMGSTYLPMWHLRLRAAAPLVLDIDRDDPIIYTTVTDLAKGSHPRLVMDGKKVYLSRYYEKEKAVAQQMARILTAGGGSDRKASVDIEAMERSFGYSFDPRQAEAIRKAVGSKLFVLTGGPGTGKTSTLKAIASAVVDDWKREGRGEPRILVAAPTGLAALRVREQMGGRDSSTIHALLEYDGTGFKRNEDNPLEGDILIVDEASMINTDLMLSLLKAVPTGMQLLVVGDADQLSAIGAGNVLSDMLRSGVVPYEKLETVFRQSMQSDIVMGAHRINEGVLPRMAASEAAPAVKMITEGTKTSRSVDVALDENGLPVLRSIDGADFLFIEESDPERVRTIITRLYTEDLPKMGFSTDDIQLISPMKAEGISASTSNLNLDIREIVNPEGLSMVCNGMEFRIGDKVILTKNEHRMGVYNGDIGYVTDVNYETNDVTVRFRGDREAVFPSDKLQELSLGYAITVHKSQGSEFKVLIVPIDRQMRRMTTRKNIYTAVTRARTLAIFVGQAAMLEKGLAQKEERFTSLDSQLQVALNGMTLRSGKAASPERSRSETFLSNARDRDRSFGYLASLLEGAGIGIHYATKAEALSRLRLVAENDTLRFPSTDEERLRGLLSERGGIVAPGLADYGFPVMDITQTEESERFLSSGYSLNRWTGSYVGGKHTAHPGEASEYRYYIGKDVLEALASNGLTGDDGLRTAVMVNLPELIENATHVEIYAETDARDRVITKHILYSVFSFEGNCYALELQGYSNPKSDIALFVSGVSLAPLPALQQDPATSEDAAPLQQLYSAAVVLEGKEQHHRGGSLLERSAAADPSLLPHFFNTANPYRAHLSHEVYGWCEGRDIYLTASGLNIHTSLHEYSHLWSRSLQIASPEVWETIKGTLRSEMPELWEQLTSAPHYGAALRSEDRIAGEVLARVMESQGADLFMEAFGAILADAAGIDEDKAADTARGLSPEAGQSLERWIGSITGSHALSTGDIVRRVLSDAVLRSPLSFSEKKDELDFDFSLEDKVKPTGANRIITEPFDFSRFTSLTGIKVNITSDREGFDPDGMTPLSDANEPISGWFDTKTESVNLYIDQRYVHSATESFVKRVNQKVLFLSVMHRGLNHLVVPANAERYQKPIKQFERALGGQFFLAPTDTDTSLRWKSYAALSPENYKRGQMVQRFYSGLFDLLLPPSIIGTLSTAQRLYCNARANEVMEGRNESAKTLELFAQYNWSGNEFFNLGKVSDTYLAVKYPDLQMSVSRTTLKYFLDNHNVTLDSLWPDFVDKLRNPIAIIQSGRPNKFGVLQYYAVTDMILPNGNYLVFNIDPPLAEKKKAEKLNNPAAHRIFAMPKSVSTEFLLNMVHFSHQNEGVVSAGMYNNSILYMSGDESRTGEEFDLLNLLKGEYKKSGASPITYVHASLDQPLRSIANIRTNFLNQKTSEENLASSEEITTIPANKPKTLRDYMERVDGLMDALGAAESSEGPSLPEPDSTPLVANGSMQENENKPLAGQAGSDRKEDTAEAESAAKGSALQEITSVTPSKDNGRTMAERLNMTLPSGLLSQSAMRKLRRENIYTVGHLQETGMEKLKEIVGERNMRQLVKFAEEEVGVSLHMRRHAPKEAEFVKMSQSEKELARRRDYVEIFTRIPESFSEQDVFLPIGKDGHPFTGSDEAFLVLKSAVLKQKWDGCPVFWTSEELSEYGFEPLDRAEATHVLIDGEYRTLYNVKQTTLATTRPTLYNKYIEDVKAGAGHASETFKACLQELRFPVYFIDKYAHSIIPFAYIKALVEEERAYHTTDKMVGFEDSVSKGIIRALKEDARKAAQQKESVPEANDVSSVKEMTQGVRQDKQKDASILDWFDSLMVIDKITNLGYMNMKEAYHELVGGVEKAELTEADFRILNGKLRERFLSLPAYKKEDIRERHEMLEQIASKLQPSQYDLSGSGIKVGQLEAGLLNVGPNRRVSIMIKSPYDASMRPVRQSSIEKAAIAAIMDYLSKVQGITFEHKSVQELTIASVREMDYSRLVDFQRREAVSEVYDTLCKSLSGGNYFSVAEHSYIPQDRNGRPFEGAALLFLTLRQSINNTKSNVWFTEQELSSLGYYHDEDMKTLCPCNDNAGRFRVTRYCNAGNLPRYVASSFKANIVASKVGVEAFNSAMQQYRKMYPEGNTVFAGIYFAVVTNYVGQKFRIDSLTGREASDEEKSALFNDLLLTGIRCQGIAKAMGLELQPIAQMESALQKQKEYTKDEAEALSSEMGLGDEFKKAISDGMTPTDALVSIGLLEGTENDNSIDEHEF